jgi:hypothetical protein
MVRCSKFFSHILLRIVRLDWNIGNRLNPYGNENQSNLRRNEPRRAGKFDPWKIWNMPRMEIQDIIKDKTEKWTYCPKAWRVSLRICPRE